MQSKKSINNNNSKARPQKITAKQAAIIDTKIKRPNLTTRQIAKLNDTDHAHVVKVLKKYNINGDILNEYKSNKSDIWMGISSRLLSSLTPEQIKKASALQLITAAGICESKVSDMSGENRVVPMVTINMISPPVEVIDVKG